MVAALGTGFAYANGAFTPTATPEAPATVAKANVQRNMKQLTAANVTKAAANLTFAGTDVSVTNPVSRSLLQTVMLRSLRPLLTPLLTTSGTHLAVQPLLQLALPRPRSQTPMMRTGTQTLKMSPMLLLTQRVMSRLQ